MEEEDSRALKRKIKSSEDKAAKKQKLDEEVEELKRLLQIVPNDEDDVYTEATPLALKLFLSFLSLLRNFDREDLEVLWQLVKEIFASSKPKNFSDDFLLTTLTYMFEKPNVEDQESEDPQKLFVITALKNNLRKFKGKDIVDNAAQVSNATTIAQGMYKLDILILAPNVKNNMKAHEHYLKHTMEQDAILREVVKQAKS
nr:hypothetical protein [Tanacetum cinerariifolium]